MKTAKARIQHLRMAPRKVRLMASLIRNMPLWEAEAQLSVRSRRAAKPLLKLLQSARANAVGLKMDVSKLYIASITVDGGPMLKRSLPRARGSASELQKKMSHVTVVLAEKEGLKAPRYVLPKKVKAGKIIPSKIEEGLKEEKRAKKSEKKEKSEAPKEEKKQAPKKGFGPRIFTRKTGTA